MKEYSELDVLQVYRALIDFGNIVEGTLLQTRTIESGLVGLKTETNQMHWVNWRELLNEDNFQKVF